MQLQEQQPRTVPIEYIGKKPFKSDNVNHTRTTWAGHGDTQPYPVDKAASLLRFKDIWRLGKVEKVAAGAQIEDGDGVVVAAGGSSVPLRNEQRGEPESGSIHAESKDQGGERQPGKGKRTLE